MKRKNLACLLGFTLAFSVAMSGCSTTSSDTTGSTSTASASTESGSETDEEVIYGEVTSVSDSSITISVGTLNEDITGGEMPDGEAPDSFDSSTDGGATEDTTDSSSADSSSDSESTASADNDSASAVLLSNTSSESSTDTSDSSASDSTDSQSEPSGEMPEDLDMSSMIELTGETMEITVTDDTVITSQSMGGGGGAGNMGGEAPSGDMPDGETPNGDMPSGETPEDLELPDDAGNTSESSTDSDSSDSTAAADSSTTDETSDSSADNSSGTADGSGEAPSGDVPDDVPSDGEMPSGEAPSDMGNSESETITIDDIEVGDIVSITLDSDGNAATITVMSMGGGMDMSGGGGAGGAGGETSDASSVSYTAVNEYTEDAEVDGEKISSTGTDENAVYVHDGASVTIKNSTITQNSDSSSGGDNSSFYGVGAAVLATDGTAYISNTTIDTDAAGGAGAFAYGDGTIYISDSTITTQQDTAGGIHVAGGGTLYAWDLTAETNGTSSAVIRSDRGSGTMVVDGGTYVSNGADSPGVYSTADITIHDADITSNSAEAVCIEGLNSLRLYDVDITGSATEDSRNDVIWNVILYQSMSGDSEEGNSTFEMQGGSLTASDGGMFYTTNTESTITLSDVDITYADDSDYFLMCTGNTNERGWGTEGQNGADCLFTAIDQYMEGAVIWDSISQLDFYMTEGSTLTGYFVDDETYAGNGGSGYCNVYISDNSTWTVTADSTVSALYCAGTITDADGNTVTIQGTDGTVYVEGTSEYTITVGSYSDSVELSGASSLTSWSDYEVEKPDALS